MFPNFGITTIALAMHSIGASALTVSSYAAAQVTLNYRLINHLKLQSKVEKFAGVMLFVQAKYFIII